MHRAWTEESFSFAGKFFNYKDISIWPRPAQQPHPPVWIPVTGSQESIEWAAKWNIPITPGSSVSGGERKGDARRDIIKYYAECQAKFGRRVTPDHFVMPIDCYIADSKAQAVKEYAPYVQYFYNTLYSFDHVTRENIQQGYYSDKSTDYMRKESKDAVANDTAYAGDVTLDGLARQAENFAWGTADEIVERVIAAAEHCGAENVIMACNRGALPQELFLNQVRRLGEEVLPRLRAHKITRVKFAEDVA
jgi:alkanesulfonate monooxygenase SsuD/methylene tetrahydromethanopterin reductase-like flavin-dependent oxidoreductase (luciferase family)